MAAKTELSDEDYLVKQINTQLESDVAAAKSLMIFSKSVFPHSFAVMFQNYKLECDEKKLTESTACLCELIKTFPAEITLIKELIAIARALSSDTDDFLKILFEQLPEEVKHDIMLIVIKNVPSLEEHCELTLMFLKRLPNARFLQHGNSIVNILLAAEFRPGMPIPVNQFRKMLVCDALPLVLKATHCQLQVKTIFELLKKAIEFYVSVMFITPTSHDITVKREASAVTSDNNTIKGWIPLLRLFELVAIRFQWNYPEVFASNYRDLNLHTLMSVLKQRNQLVVSLISENPRQEETGFEEAYFCLVITFFFYLQRFGCEANPNLFLDTTGPYKYLIMEGILLHPADSSKFKPKDFKRTNKACLIASKFGSEESIKALMSSFVTASECWELIHQHQYLFIEFKNVCSTLKLETWPVFKEFYIGHLMYNELYKEAIDHIEIFHGNTTDVTHKNKAALQTASCYYSLGDFAPALKILFDVISRLTPVNASDPVKLPVSKCISRYIYFMGYNNNEILHYCVNMLLILYKNKKNINIIYRDMTLGYMLVLLQHNLDNEYPFLNRCLETMKAAKSFSFPKFFKYIVDVVILEEISHLGSPSGGNIALDILPPPTFPANRHRAITRSQNKSAQIDLKQAFVKQTSRCYENIENLLIEFFREESKYILLPLIGDP